jgi:hypothetical protein
VASWLRERRAAREFARLLDEAESAVRTDTGIDDASGRPRANGVPDGTRRAEATFTRDSATSHGAPADGATAELAAGDSRHAPMAAENLVRTATLLIEHAHTDPPRLDNDRRVEMRAELVAAVPEAVATAGIARSSRRAGRHRHAAHGDLPLPGRHRLLAAGAGLGAVLVAAGGVAAASTSVMPGSPLYSVKRTVEKVQIDLSMSPTDRGERYLELAVTRYNEIAWLLRKQNPARLSASTNGELRDELTRLDDAVANGGPILVEQAAQHRDERAGHDLAEFLSTYEAPVEQLAQRLPAPLGQIATTTENRMRRLAEQLSAITPPLGVGTIPTAPATGTPTGSGSPGNHPASPGSSASPSTGSATTGGSSIQVPLPLPVGPGVTVPPLLPGLPTIGIGGGATSDPTPSSTTTGAPPGDPNPDD